jgi:NRAMP (natural resistance-associated macrophage protein)-like metal ion transporter
MVHVRTHALRRGRAVTLLAVLGPGLLAGLSDDDPAGITTYSVLGADDGYRMLWVLTLSTVALIVFHELGARMGIVTGKGLMTLVRERFGRRVAAGGVAVLLVANIGTMCAELAGIAAGAQLLLHVSKGVSVPLAAIVLSLLVLRGSFHRVEHVLLALSAVFVTYVISGVLAHPDWAAAGRGLVVPSMPLDRDSIYLAVATLGTTLAPWGLAFIQSYAVDKRIPVEQLRYERVDVISGAILTGVIGVFIVIACAATLHVHGLHIDEAADAARGLEPLAGHLAGTLFGLGFLGAALLAGAVVPMSTAFSVCEGFDRPADVDATFAEAPLFYGSFAAVMAVAAVVVLLPGVPLVAILVGTQALNAVLLLVILPFLIALGRDRATMGEHALASKGFALTVGAFAFVAVSIFALGYLTLAG